jgi:ubiquinone/menaquinone biosynthesis C-methylase UbiE
MVSDDLLRSTGASTITTPSGTIQQRSASTSITREQLRDEFDTWARNGWGIELEIDNRPLIEAAVELLRLDSGTRVLDLSCGSGLAARLIAARAVDTSQFVHITGVDISEEMLRLARTASAGDSNVEYLLGSADRIPSPEEHFDEVVCIESFYYYPDQDRALNEMYRVMKHGARCYLALRLYSDNPYSGEFLSHLSIPAHVRSAAEYASMLRAHGFGIVRMERLPEKKRRRGGYIGILVRGVKLLARRPTQWIPAVKDKLRIVRKRDRARAIGALLLIASKP